MDIAILGYGIVGSGVAEIIGKNSQSIAARAGEQIRIKKILDIRDFPGDAYSRLLTREADEIFGDDEIKVVVETIGGVKIARDYTIRAFNAKKHVVTSNKELVAAHGPELLNMAAGNGVSYLFEASVGGGIPIIRPLSQCLAANIINEISGILNGTTNYILSQMRNENRDFQDALKSAQQKGYAEADPTADIEGHDACRKLAILSSIAFNEFVDYRNIYTEGITKISLADIRYAQAMNSTIKLLAVGRRESGRIFARVSPAIINMGHPLSNVEDVFNAITVKGDAIGDAMFYGRGAGKLPTASAVVADVIDIAKHNEICRYSWNRQPRNNVIPAGECESRFFIRVAARNSGEAVKYIKKEFGSIEFIQPVNKETENELAFTTHKMTEAKTSEMIRSIEGIASISKVINTIRIEED